MSATSSSTSVLDATALRALEERIQREVDDGRIPAGQLAVGLDGEVVHTQNFGEATDDTRFAVFSVTKAFIAATVWQLLAEGTLELDTPVTDLVPSFAAAERVTLRHLLTHTGGFPYAPLGPPEWDTREGRLERFAGWHLQWEPGERFEYHATSGHWVIAEMIEAVEGEDYRDVVARRVTEPLGLVDFMLGGRDAVDADVAELVAVGSPPTAAEIEQVFGIPDVDLGEITPDILLQFNLPEAKAVGIPGGGGVTDASTLARFYQALMHNRDGIWDPAVLAHGTATVHCTLPDPMKQMPSNRTLGLILAGDDGKSALRGFGHTVSPRAFGHGGAGGQITWADPDSGLSVAFLTSGIELNFLREGRRTAAIGSRAGVLRGA